MNAKATERTMMPAFWTDDLLTVNATKHWSK